MGGQGYFTHVCSPLSSLTPLERWHGKPGSGSTGNVVTQPSVMIRMSATPWMVWEASFALYRNQENKRAILPNGCEPVTAR